MRRLATTLAALAITAAPAAAHDRPRDHARRFGGAA